LLVKQENAVMATTKELTSAQRTKQQGLAAKRAESEKRKLAARAVAQEQADKDAQVKVEQVDELPPLPQGRPITALEMRQRQRLISNTIRDQNRAAANAAGKAVHDVLQGRKGRDVHSRIQKRDTATEAMRAARAALEKAGGEQTK
jgi:hypothetical protein